MNAKKLARLGLLTALALIIYIVELRLPDIAPIPGMKLGLANIVTVCALFSFTPKETALILYARIILGSIFASNPSAVLYSISGGTLCLVGMVLLRKHIGKKSIWLCSVYGAVLHNIGQTAAAVFIMQTSAVLTYLPILIFFACISGTLTGLTAQFIIVRTNKKD